MKYNSIGEYFYKLSNRCLVLVLLPVLMVWGLYLLNQYFLTGLPWLSLDDDLMLKLLWSELGAFGLLIWLQYGLVLSDLKKLRKEFSLGKRMKEYTSIVFVRYWIFGLLLFIVGASVFLTGELIYLYILPLPVLIILMYWPSPGRLSKDLRLKTDEREILKNKTMGV